MKIYRVYFYVYDEEGRAVEETVERFYASYEKAEAARAAHKEGPWTSKVYIEEVDVL